MSVKTYSLKSDGNKKLSEHFKVKEFRCKDGSDKILIESGLIDTLERVFEHFNCGKINITSGYRTAAHDKAVGGRGGGNHVKGKAADFVAYTKTGKKIKSADIVLFLEDIGVLGIGYRCGGGTYATHMDINYRTQKWFGDEKISMSKSIWNIKSGCNSFYDYLDVFKPYNVRITASALNVRRGAGMGYRVVGIYRCGAVAEITRVSGTWGQTKDGWISVKPAYVEKVRE